MLLFFDRELAVLMCPIRLLLSQSEPIVAVQTCHMHALVSCHSFLIDKFNIESVPIAAALQNDTGFAELRLCVMGGASN